ncbi:MAG: hypothetical protein O2854_06645 [Chloroflexi bacterium]|nr:hypothetical protein [Chloroflexota bacterium]
MEPHAMRMSDKYKDEIEDILRQAGEWSTPEPIRKRQMSVWRLAWLQLKTAVSDNGWSITPGRLMLTSLALFLAALIVHAAAPNLGLIGPLAIAGIIAFIVAYGFFLMRPKRGGGTYRKMWRGEVVDDER